MTVDDLLQAGKEVHFVKQGLVLNKDSKSQDKLIHDIQVVLARNYINNLSEETKKGMLEKVRQGGYYGWAPLGYLNEDKSIVPDPITAPYILKAYRLYDNGMSIRDIARYLNMAGVKGKLGGGISNNTVHWLLTNPLYVGKVRYKGQVYPGNHESLVSPDLFLRVSRRLNLKIYNRKGKPTKSFPLRGLLICSCSRHMTAETKKGHNYYHCSNKDCPEPYAREDRLTLEIEHLLDDVEIDQEMADLMLRAAREMYGIESENVLAEQTRLARKINEVGLKISRLVDTYIDGRLGEDVYTKRLLELQIEEENAKNLLSRVSNIKSIEPVEKIITIALTCGGIFRRVKGEEKREFLDFVLSNLVISDGKIASYQLKQPFDVMLKNAPVSTWLPLLDSVRTDLLDKFAA